MVLITNYALVIWASNMSKSALGPFAWVQKMEAQAIIEEFYIVSLLVTELEAAIIPLEHQFFTA